MVVVVGGGGGGGGIVRRTLALNWIQKISNIIATAETLKITDIQKYSPVLRKLLSTAEVEGGGLQCVYVCSEGLGTRPCRERRGTHLYSSSLALSTSLVAGLACDLPFPAPLLGLGAAPVVRGRPFGAAAALELMVPFKAYQYQIMKYRGS